VVTKPDHSVEIFEKSPDVNLETQPDIKVVRNNKRDLEPDRWGPTDYPETVNHEDMGDLKLSDQQIDDLLALMEAFTDRNLLEMKSGQLFPEVPEGIPTTEERKAFFHEPPARTDVTVLRRPKKE